MAAQQSHSAHSLIHDLAQKHGVSPAAVQEALASLQRTGGSQAQFAHHELGGYGQWMPGMLMIGDMFNHQLKGRVDALFHDLSHRLGDFAEPPASAGGQDGSRSHLPPLPGQQPLQPLPSLPNQGSNWYPPELGLPSSSGAQNDFRWAFFPGTRRLAIQVGQDLSIYDTEDHAIGSASQQQDARGGHIVLTSQKGNVDVAKLRRVR